MNNLHTITGNYDPDGPVVHRLPDGTVRYRMSGIGSCVRSLTASRLGLPAEAKSDYVKSTANAGHDFEDRLLQATGLHDLCKFNSLLRLPLGYKVEAAGKIDTLQQITFPEDDEPISWRLGDAKFLSPARAEALANVPDLPTLVREWPGYAWQMSCYWHALNLSGYDLTGFFFAVGERLGDPGNWSLGQVRVNEFSAPPFTYQQIMARVREVENYAQASEVGGEDVLPVCDGYYKYCNHAYLHEETPVVVVPSQMGEALARTDELTPEPTSTTDPEPTTPSTSTDNLPSQQLFEAYWSAEQAVNKLEDLIADSVASPSPGELGLELSACWCHLFGRVIRSSEDRRRKLRTWLKSETKGQKKTSVGPVTITWTTPRKQALDKKSLAVDHPDIWSQFLTITERVVVDESFDEEEFRAAHPDLWSQYQRKTGTSTMRITKR